MTLHSCEHCGTGFTPSEPDARFCCRGCEQVAALIHGRGLDRYYRLKEGTATMPVRSRPFEEHDFSWLEPRMTSGHTSSRQGVASMDCSVEGISCIGCVWLIGALFEDRPGAIRATANPATGVLHLEWQADACDLRGYLQELARFGYVAGPPAAAPGNGEMRSLAGRMGLCGAFMLNAMAFSLPGYLGMRPDFEFAGLFVLIAFASASLAMLVGGGYFMVRAWRALRIRTLHIDLPIALGLMAAYAGSIAGWIRGEERLLYFDFVATFTFLMLLGRWIQTAAVEKNRRRFTRRSPLPSVVRGRDGDLPLAAIEPGQAFELEPGRALPVGSILTGPAAEVSLEWIRGESDPVTMQPGARLPAGTILLSHTPVRVTADESWNNSLLQQLTAPGAGDRGSPVFQRLLKVYLSAVITIGISTGIWRWLGGDGLGALQAMISIFVVSCPCALGVAVPLADEIAASRLARAGAFVRHTSLWPRLRRVKHVVFDKTGTLTSERPELLDAGSPATLPDEAALALVRLTRASLHPVSRTLLEHLGGRGQALLETHGSVPVEEHPGKGVTCTSGDARWFLGKAEEGITVLTRNDLPVARFHFRDALRPAAAAALAPLVKRGLTLHILSGDAPEKVARVAEALGISPANATGGLDPEQKAARVAALDHSDTLYLGDGANDSLAFDAAYVTGTPVVDRSLLESKADFYSLGSGLHHLPEAFAAADARARGIHAAFAFALAYNLVVISLAAMCRMNPLLAAIVMPLSSVAAILLVVTVGRKGNLLTTPSSTHHETDEHDQTNPGPGAIQRVPA